MNQSEKTPAQSPDKKIEEKGNIVRKFFSDTFPEIEVIVESSKLSEKERNALIDFYKEFVSHLQDDSYIERVMVSTGPLISSHDEISPLRRIKLEDGTYSIENSLYVFRDFFNEAFGTTKGEMSEVRKAILDSLEEAFINKS